jgi:DNA-binding MarR family transcriptional regulator
MIMQMILSSPMAATEHPPARSSPPAILGTGFLLSQLGAHSAAAFAQRIAPLGLTPPQVGVLRAIADQPGRTQPAIADEFGLPPSRMVAFIDDLEARELVERRRDPADRRVHLLHLSEPGERMLTEIATIGRAAERDLLSALTAAERKQLSALLTRLVDQQGLARGVHPGYSRLRHDQGPPGPCPV